MIKLLSVAIVSSAFLMACSTTNNLSTEDGNEPSGESAESNMIGGEVAAKLYSKDKTDSLESSIEFMFYENPVLHYQDSINSLIKTYISGIVSFGGGATEQNSDLSVEYFEEAIDIFKDEYNRQLEFVDGGGVWQTLTSVNIYQDNPEYVEVSLVNWNYEGGVHGNGWSEQYVYDLKTGHELKLEDFFSNIDILTKRAEAIFRADQELEEGVSLVEAGFWFDAGFELNENFSFNENSVDFLYNRYEIAPYAAGTIIVTIPMEEVKDLLKRKVHF